MSDSKEKVYWLCGMIVYHSIALALYSIFSDSALALFLNATGTKAHVMLFALPYQLLLALCDKYMTVPAMTRLGSREKVWEERVKTTYTWSGIYMGIWLAVFCVICMIRPGYIQDFPMGMAVSRVLHLLCNILILCNLSLILRMSGNVKLARGSYLLAFLAMCVESVGLKRWIEASTNFELNLLFNWAYQLNVSSLIVQILLICVMLLLLRQLCVRRDLL